MARPAPHGRSACAWWRGAVVVAALAGYVAAWGGTSAGQGWRLAPHLTLAHTQAPPPLVAETPHPVLATLRAGSDKAKAEEAHAHTHGEAHVHASAHTRSEKLFGTDSERPTMSPLPLGEGQGEGHSWTLGAHSAPPLTLAPAAPSLRGLPQRVEREPGPSYRTASPAHAHETPLDASGGHHASPDHAESLATARAEPPPAAGQSGAHWHGSVVHSHAPPPARDDAPAVSLDKHRLPAGACVPLPPSADAAPTGGPDGAPAHVGLPVETPPPLARG